MDNISIKTLKTDSPKTPGGISKSLLTPCRRLGLSRNYKKAGPAPFISPLSSDTSAKVVVVVEKKQPRKRKKSVECVENEEESEATPKTPIVDDGVQNEDEGCALKPAKTEDDVTVTPTRHFEVPHKNRSKTILTGLSKSHDKTPLTLNQPDHNQQEAGSKVFDDTTKTKTEEGNVVPLKRTKSKNSLRTCKENAVNDTINLNTIKEKVTEGEIVVTPLQKAHTKSNRCKKILAQQKSPTTLDEAPKNTRNSSKHNASLEDKTLYTIKPRSPNDLTKECIVVIQKKIFKTDKNNLAKNKGIKINTLDSDSDDVPLCQLNKEEICEKKEGIINKKESKEQQKPASNDDIINIDDENEDFVETKKKKVTTLEDKATSIGGLKKKTKIEKPKPETKKTMPVQSVRDFDDEDDFDFDNKKTILIRKTYEKVTKPQKAKSTGSITQRDIDELKARIEAKKKLLIARYMTEDTEELRSLIKKWQKGCQDALMELMDLMKNKFPDKQNMDYSEMLSMLKIPTNLVGYDEENDCFNTPDDANIVLSKFNDL